MIDYAENLCEAMKIIFEKQIKQLSFDITIDATVIDATNAKNGVYTVSHDGATFIAYSTDTSFKEKDVVMVTVPQGNYDNQKMIIGKQVDKDKEKKPITYQSPFSQMIDLSNNLIIENNKEYSLLATNEKNNNEENQKISIIDIDLLEEYQSNGYTRLGLKADFSTWLEEFNVISGNYGLILTLTFQNPDKEDEDEKLIIPYTFDSDEFFGDVYNFRIPSNQEAVFDISDYSKYILQSIKLEAYQANNFKTIEGKLSYDNNSPRNNNIFIKNPYVCLGIASEDFNRDSAEILNTSSSVYTDSTEKNLKLKWIHQDLDTNNIYLVQDGRVPENYEIRWYKFQLGEPSPDKFMDAHWIRFYGCKNNADENGSYDITNSNEDIVTNKINIKFKPNSKNQTEQLRAVIIVKENNYENFVAQTPILTLNNSIEVPREVDQFDANALGIQFNDTEKGKYYYYDRTGKKILSKEKNPEHILKAVFDKNTNLENKKDLKNQTYTSIRWVFPKNNTMIIPLDPGGKDSLRSQSGQPDENNISPSYTVNINENNYEILFENENTKSILETMKYKIDDNYSFNKTRNTVYLEIKINGQKYVSSATMFFGISGTSGSEYTIIVDWGESGYELPVFEVKNDGELKGSVWLQDPNGEKVTLNENAKYEYSWYQKKVEDSNGLLIKDKENNNPLGENNSIFRLTNTNSQVTMNDLYILEVKLINFGNYNLVSRYPIALKRENDDSFQINSMSGVTTVRYASDGTITLDDKNPYSIVFYDKDEEIKSVTNDNGYWQIITDDNIDNNFLPELIEIEGDVIEEFITELDKIKPNSQIEKTLLDKILFIYNNQDSKPLEDFIRAINEDDGSMNNNVLNINRSSESFKIILKNFKNYLSKFKNINELFICCEEKYSEKILRQKNSILQPPSVYFKNQPLCGVQYIYNNDETLYTQPIYVYQDNYPSATINQWNGKDLILDNDKGTILANRFSAGKKEDDNTFSGVIIGDWENTDADASISNNTGIYGFNYGAMSYAFKEDGTAFIGKDGFGRIVFDGNEGIIESAKFNLEDQVGSQFNFTKGSLHLFGEKETTIDQQEYYSLILNSNPENIKPIFSVGRNYNFNQRIKEKEDLLNQYKDAIDNAKNKSENLLDIFNDYYTIYQKIEKIVDEENDNNLTNEAGENDFSFLKFIKNEKDMWDYYSEDKQGLKTSITRLRTSKALSKIIFDFQNFDNILSEFAHEEDSKYFYNGTSLTSPVNNYTNLDTHFYKIFLLKDKTIEFLINEYIYFLYKQYEKANNSNSFLDQINTLYPDSDISLSIKDFRQRLKRRLVSYPSSAYLDNDTYYLEIEEKYYPLKQSPFNKNLYQIENFIFYPNEIVALYQGTQKKINNINENLLACALGTVAILVKNNQFIITFDEEETNIFKLRKYLQKKYSLNNLEENIEIFMNSIQDISQTSNIYIQESPESYIFSIRSNLTDYSYKERFGSEEKQLSLILCKTKLLKKYQNNNEANWIDSKITNEENLINYFNIEFDYTFPDNYKNDLIFLNKNGGYLTSKNYRPTIALIGDNDMILRNPTDNQKWSINDTSTYGLKGFIIDLTNDRIVLGNNSSIVGYQSHAKRETTALSNELREFSISTGANFSSVPNNILEELNDSSNFIEAYAYDGFGNDAKRSIFKVDWNGNVIIRGDLIVKGSIINSSSST